MHIETWCTYSHHIALIFSREEQALNISAAKNATSVSVAKASNSSLSPPIPTRGLSLTHTHRKRVHSAGFARATEQHRLQQLLCPSFRAVLQHVTPALSLSALSTAVSFLARLLLRAPIVRKTGKKEFLVTSAASSPETAQSGHLSHTPVGGAAPRVNCCATSRWNKTILQLSFIPPRGEPCSRRIDFLYIALCTFVQHKHINQYTILK